jgi:3-dehydroquinate synthase
VFTFPAGEASKTRATWADLTDRILAAGLGRDSGIVALGGGVTGDLAGFVAATYMRGIPVLQVPTSLLAMVDASIGGKTGVDVPAGKNLVGAFHQPAAVLIDPAALSTLPAREWRQGLAEVVKHALIADRSHFEQLERDREELAARTVATVEPLIRRSVTIKAEVVGADETESGRRAVLNAGHTMAHALEQASGFALRHGEAVAIGLVTEAALGEAIGITSPGTRDRLAALLGGLGLPVDVPAVADRNLMLGAMAADKKNRDGAIRFALPSAIGSMHGSDDSGWTVPVPEVRIREFLSLCD